NYFEGYVIYRSTDPQFSDQQTITDVNGSRFLFSPLKTERGVDAKFDLANGLKGPSPIPYPGRGVQYDLGDDTGLFHTYVDTNNVVNGQTYYYSVVAYDRGYAGDGGQGFANGIPPSETSKTITYNPTTDSFVFDVNTVAVTPAPRVAGYVPAAVDAEMGIQRVAGHGTGTIDVRVVDELAVLPDRTYNVVFEEVDGDVVYSVVDQSPVAATVVAQPGRFASLGYDHILPET